MDYRCVGALSEEKSFSQASEVLGLSQPAISARLRRIKENLDVRLFERGRRGAEPTPGGDAFTDAAGRIIDMPDRSVEVARNADRGLGRHLRIGTTQIVAVQVAIPILKAFREENRFARFRLTESISFTLEAQVEQNSVDLAFPHPPIHQAGLSELPLISQRLVEYDATALPHDRPPTIRYTRRDAPVLAAELDRHEPDGVDPDALAEVDRAIGAIVMFHAGYGPFVVPEGFPSPFERTETCLDGRRSRRDWHEHRLAESGPPPVDPGVVGYLSKIVRRPFGNAVAFVALVLLRPWLKGAPETEVGRSFL